MGLKMKTNETEIGPLTFGQKLHLCCGEVFLTWDFPEYPFDSDDHRRAVWFKYKNEILEERHPSLGPPQAQLEYEGEP